MFINILPDSLKLSIFKTDDGYTFYTNAELTVQEKEFTNHKNHTELNEFLINYNNKKDLICIKISPKREITYELLEIESHHILKISPGANELAIPLLINKNKSIQLNIGDFLFFPTSKKSNDQLRSFYKNLNIFSPEKKLSIYNAMVQPSLTTRLGMLENEVYKGKNYEQKYEELPKEDNKSKLKPIFKTITTRFNELKIGKYILIFLLSIILAMSGLLASKYINDRFVNKIVRYSLPEIDKELLDYVNNNYKNEKKYSKFYTDYFSNNTTNPEKNVLAWIKIMLSQKEMVFLKNKEFKISDLEFNNMSNSLSLLKENYNRNFSEKNSRSFSEKNKLILKFIFCHNSYQLKNSTKLLPQPQFGNIKLPEEKNYCSSIRKTKSEKILEAIKSLGKPKTNFNLVEDNDNIDKINQKLLNFEKKYSKKYSDFYKSHLKSKNGNIRIYGWIKIILLQKEKLSKGALQIDFYKTTADNLKNNWSNFSKKQKLLLQFISCKENNWNSNKLTFELGVNGGSKSIFNLKDTTTTCTKIKQMETQKLLDTIKTLKPTQ